MKGFLKEKFSNKKILSDFVLNIMASAVYTIITQLIVLPYLGRTFSAAEFGTILTVIALVNTLGFSAGRTLNDTRVLMQHEYNKKGVIGDYNPLFVIVSVIISVLAVSLINSMFTLSAVEIIACVIISVLIFFRVYHAAAFRIIINYKKYFMMNLAGASGYLIGIYLTSRTGIWYFPYIIGELFACIYVLFTSHIIKDRLQFTPLLKQTVKKFSFLLMASLLVTVIWYMDKLFIYPMIGPEQVAIFNVASYMGKTASLVITPMSAVLLTYYAKRKSLSLRDFYIRQGIFVGISILFLIFIYTIGQPVLRFFYPTIIDRALKYYYIANLAMVVRIYGNTVQPVLLRYAKSKWQPIIHGTHLAVYVLAGYIGIKVNGLMGFCYAILIVNSIKVSFMVYLSHRTLKNSEKNLSL